MNKIKLFGIVIIFCLLFLFFTRLILPREIDDVTTNIACSPDLLEKSDFLWVIPLYNNESISMNPEWCKSISKLNKTIGLHGIHHTYKEFDDIRDEEYINRGIIEFEKCFGFKPEMFKAPQLVLNSENKKRIKNMGFDVNGKFNQLFHKVYHCSDTGKFPNWFIAKF